MRMIKGHLLQSLRISTIFVIFQHDIVKIKDKFNKPENQDEDALGKIEQQQHFVILDLTLRVLDSYGYSLKISMLFMHRHFKNVLRHFKIVLTHLENVLKYFKNVFMHFNVYAT